MSRLIPCVDVRPDIFRWSVFNCSAFVLRLTSNFHAVIGTLVEKGFLGFWFFHKFSIFLCLLDFNNRNGFIVIV